MFKSEAKCEPPRIQGARVAKSRTKRSAVGLVQAFNWVNNSQYRCLYFFSSILFVPNDSKTINVESIITNIIIFQELHFSDVPMIQF